ncbi:general substrate transporter [Mrakia frigida]|uniref:sugar porter family MFS transporter n=1 Tax=Mrakia frigida TaxID=29902 RepID=UPI003FCBF73B
MIINGHPVGGTAIALSLFASIGGFLFGYDIGQIADILPMPDFVERFAEVNTADPTGPKIFSNVRSGLIVGLLSIGTLGGAFIGSFVSDALGRRKAMTVSSFIVCVGVAIQISSDRVWQQFAVGRLVTGLGVGALSGSVPIYMSELAPKQVRGSLVALYQVAITLGIFIAYCIGIGTRELDGPGAWRVLVGLTMIFAAILGIGILFMPESPRWLMQRGKFDEARESLARVRGVRVSDHDRYVEFDFDEIAEGVALDEKEGAGTYGDCFSPRLLKRTLLGMALQMFQQLTGANYFFYYGSTIFNGVGISDFYVTQIIIGLVSWVCTFPGIWFLERFGRRKPLILGGLWQTGWLFVFAIAGTVKNPETDQGIGKLMIVSTCMFIAGYASTWGPGVWIATGELYPQRTRSKMQSLSVSTNWLWNFLLAFFTPFITGDIGYGYGFVFAGANFIGVAIVYFFLKEGSGLSLEHLAALWEDNSTPAWRSGSWVPPGYETRTGTIELSPNEKPKGSSKEGPVADGQHVENVNVEKGMERRAPSISSA